MFDETIVTLNKQLVAGETTAVELVEKAFERIESIDSELGAFLALTKEEALESAKASDEKGYSPDRPLQGIPIGIKDNIITDGVKTTAASRMLEDFVPIYNATVMDKLEAAGAIMVGKLNMDEFAMGGSTETSYFKKTTNAFDSSKVPGGSSGGSAAAVASGEIVASLGTDTGGSVRQPAAFNGVVGMKPTYGRVSRFGVIAFASSLDQVGPITRTVEDNAILLEAISGVDKHDSTSSDIEVPNFTKGLTTDLSGMKIALPEDFTGEGVDEEVDKATAEAVKVFESLGATVETVSMPHSKYGIPAYYILSSSEASSNLQRFDGIRFGYRAEDVKNLEELYVQSRSEGFGDEVQRRILLGTFSLSSGYYDAYFKKAGKVRTLIREDFEKVFSEYDLIIGPTTTSTAFSFGDKMDDPIAMYKGDLFTVPVNLAGIPAISIPSGLDSEGLPIGLQIIGNYFDESTIYKAAYAFEQSTEFHNNHPSVKGE